MSLIRKTTKSVTTYSTELNRDDILNLIRAARTVEIPDSAAITFRVPGGGDWSNALVDISADHPIHVSWTTEQET